MEPKILTIEECAKYLKLSIISIRIYSYQGKIPYNIEHGQKMYKKEDLDIYLENKKIKIKNKNCMYNDDFKVIDTEIKAYFLGLFYADGSICNLKGGEKSKNFYCRISLHVNDRNIIEKIKKEFSFFQMRIHDFSKYDTRNGKQIEIRYYGRYLYQDLKSHGLIERKSYENKNFLKIPESVPENLLHHFIRGYFDGDGSISIAHKRPNLRRIEFCSVSETMIDSLSEWFSNRGCSPQKKRKKFNKNIQKQDLFIIEWWKSDFVLKIKELMYNDSSFFMTRKREKFDNFEIKDPLLRSFKCQHCKSNRLKKVGKRSSKKGIAERFHCISCKKRITKYFPVQVKSDELLETPKALDTKE